jgi:cytochrome c5
MKPLLPLSALALAAAIAASAQTPQGPASPARDYPVTAARAKSPGEAAFLARCQFCHVEMGFGTLTLAKRLGPKQALLASRTDLDPDYIRGVVRNGLNTMPPITRVDVSDPELDQIVKYLTRNKARKAR